MLKKDVDLAKAKDTLDIVAKVSQLDQRVLTVINIPEIVRKIAKINDIPSHSEDEMKQIAENILSNVEGGQDVQQQ